MTKQDDSPPATPKGLRRFLSFRLTNLSRKFAIGSKKLFYEPYQLNMREVRVLMTLYEFKCLSSSEIGDIANLDRGTISRGVKELLKRRLISGQVFEDDLRRSDLELTPAGVQLAESCTNIAHRRSRYVLDVLNEQERVQLDDFLSRIEDRLDEMNEKPDLLRQLRGNQAKTAAE